MHSQLTDPSFAHSMSTPHPAPQGVPSESVPERPEGASAAQITAIAAENRELRAELDQIRAERGRLLDLQRQVMQLLGTTRTEKIIHDLRNLLNERDLLKALADEM